MRRPRRAEILSMAVIALGAGLIVAVPLGRLLRGWTIDAETTLRWRILGARHPAKTSTTVVIALDEETYRTPPFKGSPTLTWTSDIGGIVGAALDAGAKVVGIDIVFASSIEDSAIRFREGELGASLRGFDRDYLRTLAGGARAGKIVLGEIATTDGFVRPSAGPQRSNGYRRRRPPGPRRLRVGSGTGSVAFSGTCRQGSRRGASLRRQRRCRAWGMARPHGGRRFGRRRVLGRGRGSRLFAGGSRGVPQKRRYEFFQAKFQRQDRAGRAKRRE